MNFETVGRWLVLLGVAVALAGGLIWLFGRFFPNADQFPGTIRIQGSGFTCIFPLLGSILLSILLTILLNIIAKTLK